MNLDGTHVAMVTPLNDDGTINEEEYRNLIDFLIDVDLFEFGIHRGRIQRRWIE